MFVGKMTAIGSTHQVSEYKGRIKEDFVDVCVFYFLERKR